MCKIKKDTLAWEDNRIYAIYDRKRQIIYYNSLFSGIFKIYLMC